MLTFRGDELLSEAAPVNRENRVITGTLLLAHESYLAVAARNRSQEGRRPSGSSVLCNLLNFPDETGLHVENKTPHRNFFGDPWM
jgi:hypothetical protein